MIEAYEGSHPYAFISYSHKDAAIVMPAIEAMQRQGILIWYDAGIEAGSEWPEYIASHLKNCSCVLTFISENFIDSPNCRRELNFAQDLRKDILNIFIDDVQLTDGMRMQLGLNQALIKKKFRTNGEFHSAISNARILASCKQEPQAQAPKQTPASPPTSAKVSDPIPKSAPADVPVTAAKPNDTQSAPSSSSKSKAKKSSPAETATPQQKRRKKLITWICILIELAYIYVGLETTSILTASEGTWGLIWKFAAIHVAFSLVNFIIIKTLGKKLPSTLQGDIAFATFLFFVFVVLVVVIASPFLMVFEVGGILKLLISIGLNILPATVGALLYISAG